MDKLNCAAVVKRENNVLYLIEFFATKEVDLYMVVYTDHDFSFTEVVLGFIPKHSEGLEWRIWKDEVNV
ncbi:hypothetical protein DCO56_02125 [Sphingobacterium athyrii]|uniref:Uncharacterized protein n=1 Tax=Sphingobacterium athyrii TaxID=2152717 RepID=A0A363NYB7_9SPHI|nr:hypothetical protein DCO56_02125 [Sphingobacterium athyrii]